MPNQSDAAPKAGKSDKRAASKKAAPEKGAARQSVTADQVAQYLRQHPNFLAENPDLVDGQTAPNRHQETGVVDLQHVMLQRLRDEVGELTGARDDLIVTGRSNLTTQARVHEAILSLLNARNFEQFVVTITTDLSVILDLDVITVAVEPCDQFPQGQSLKGAAGKGVVQLPQDYIEETLGRASILLRGDVTGDPAVFGSGAGLVRSDALIRLSIGAETPSALLALGSRQPDQFQPGQGTELLTFLARVLECNFRTWLSVPAA